MYDLNKAYSKKFFIQHKSLAWRVPIVVNAIMKVINPKSVIDVGCGSGELIKGFGDATKHQCYGIEGTTNALGVIEHGQNNHVFIRDIRVPLDDVLLNRAGLATCLNVAEHIEDEYASVFVDNLCSLSNIVLMAASPPGQGGRYHVNCQPYDYWFYKFIAKGYKANHVVVDKIREHWGHWKRKKEMKAYYYNLTCWEAIK